jgi:hypothetical protein
VFSIEFHAPFALFCEIASMIKTARTTISRTMAIGNTRWNSFRAKPKPNGKISGKPIGIIWGKNRIPLRYDLFLFLMMDCPFLLLDTHLIKNPN